MLAPFLPTFLARADLTVEGAFVDEPARHAAIARLHHLATGERDAPEHTLPLAKLLAGLPPHALHVCESPLTDAEIEEGDDLLAAALAHAPMLGQISIAGLRASFLIRPGQLTTRDGHWLLRVERRDYDLLLDRLPWTFSWVRLPWMPDPLQVEW